jgi:hypothetical protein
MKASQNGSWLETIKPWIEILGLLLLCASVASYVWLARLQGAANKIYQRSTELNQQSIALTQKSLEASQEGLKLGQKSLEALQDGLKIAQQANTISENALTASNTPWIQVELDTVNSQTSTIELKNGNPIDALEVVCRFINHSQTPALQLRCLCYIEDIAKIKSGSLSAISTDYISVMPQETFTQHSWFFNIDTEGVLRDIKAGKAVITFYITYVNALDKKQISDLSSYVYRGGLFYAIKNEYNPSESIYSKLLGDSPNGNGK